MSEKNSHNHLILHIAGDGALGTLVADKWGLDHRFAANTDSFTDVTVRPGEYTINKIIRLTDPDLVSAYGQAIIRATGSNGTMAIFAGDLTDEEELYGAGDNSVRISDEDLATLLGYLEDRQGVEIVIYVTNDKPAGVAAAIATWHGTPFGTGCA